MSHKKQKGDSPYQKVTTEKTEAKSSESDIHEYVGDKSETAETSQSDIVNDSIDEEVPQSIGFLHAFFLSVLNFIKPWYEFVKGYNPYVENILNFLERIEKRLEDFIRKHDGISDIKWDDLMEFLSSAYAEVKSYFTGDHDLLVISHQYWHKTHLAILKSLEDIERIHEYMFPVIDGVDPLFKIDKNKKYSIRQICFYMNMNLIHRVWLTLAKSVSDWLVSFCSFKSTTIPKQTAKSYKDATSTNKEKTEIVLTK